MKANRDYVFLNNLNKWNLLLVIIGKEPNLYSLSLVFKIFNFGWEKECQRTSKNNE